MYQIGSKAQTSTRLRLRLTCNPGLKPDLEQKQQNKWPLWQESARFDTKRSIWFSFLLTKTQEEPQSPTYLSEKYLCLCGH